MNEVRLPSERSPAQAAPDRFALSTSIFLRVLATIHLAAFGSFWAQAAGLIGPHGILPAFAYLGAIREQIPGLSLTRLPTLLWLTDSSALVPVLCGAGVCSAILLFIGIAPGACLLVLWACYLSLMNAAQVFLGFQWDALLLETTLLGLFIAPWTFHPGWRALEPPRLARWLLTWLLFRLMLLSGVVKLSSSDPTWRNLTALKFHFETQPLPTPLAWWANQLPTNVLRSCCAVMFAIELIVPFFLFFPRRVRHVAAALLILLQLAIALTGNYAFFNFLTISLCLLCFDDAAWRGLTRRRWAKCHSLDDTLPEAQMREKRDRGALARKIWRWMGMAGAAFVVAFTTLEALPSFDSRLRWPGWFVPVLEVVAPFSSLNNYGLFAVMTTSRPELVIEGSNDSRDWQAYELPFKPGDLDRRPRFVAPLQPRLDWQLWFAALGTSDQNPWVMALCEQILRGTPEVLALMARNPFPGHPPRYLRIVRYDYHFTSAAERARNGHWWRRTPVDLYVMPLSLR